MTEEINNLKFPVRPSESGGIEDNRKFIIWLRDRALESDHLDTALALSHTNAWLTYLIQLEEFFSVGDRKQ